MDSENGTRQRALMEMLEHTAERQRPRMFSIYGTYRSDPTEPVLGWGIEFADGDGSIYRGAGHGSVHSSGSAEQLRRFFSTIADVELKWLDG